MEFLQSIDRSIAAEEIKHNQTHDPHATSGDLFVKQLQTETIQKQTSVNHLERQEEIHPDDKKKDTRDHRPNSSKETDSDSSSPLNSREPDKGSQLDLLA